MYKNIGMVIQYTSDEKIRSNIETSEVNFELRS